MIANNIIVVVNKNVIVPLKATVFSTKIYRVFNNYCVIITYCNQQLLSWVNDRKKMYNIVKSGE